MQNDNWYLNQIHLHYTKRAEFDRDLATRNISKKSIAFIDEGRLIWTHGKFYKCEVGTWDEITSFVQNLNFAKTTNADGSTTYTLQGKDVSGNDFSTDASFTILKDIFIENAQLIDDGKILQVVMSNGDIINIDLSKLFQLQDFINSPSVEFTLSPDPDNPTNTLISAYARSIISATNPNVSVVAGNDGVIISTDNASVTVGTNNIFVESENLTLSDDFKVSVPNEIVIEGGKGSLSIGDNVELISSSGNVNIESSEQSVNVQGNSVNISSTDGNVVIQSSEGNSVKILSPLYLSEEYSDVEQALQDLQDQIDSGGGGSSLRPGNGIRIEDDVISIDNDQYFEPTQQYWDN